jgi:spore coat protein U-like protein
MLKKLALAAIAVALGAGAAHAAIYASSTMTVQVTVNPTCNVSGVTTYNFGTITNTTGSNTGSNASFTVNCSGGLTFAVKATPTNATVGSNWQMHEATSNTFIKYNLQWDTGGGFQTWDAVTNPSVLGDGANHVVVIRGIIPVQATPPTGWNTANPYTDIVTITVEA